MCAHVCVCLCERPHLQPKALGVVLYDRPDVCKAVTGLIYVIKFCGLHV
jgi:hypothetical protein